jgi:hypothetical protein
LLKQKLVYINNLILYIYILYEIKLDEQMPLSIFDTL